MTDDALLGNMVRLDFLLSLLRAQTSCRQTFSPSRSLFVFTGARAMSEALTVLSELLAPMVSFWIAALWKDGIFTRHGLSYFVKVESPLFLDVNPSFHFDG